MNMENNSSEQKRTSKKSSRRWKIVQITVIAAVVVIMSFFSFLLPLRPEVSETEKRKLAQFPAFSFSALFSGSYFSDITAWYADTVPLRDTFTGISSRLQHLLGTGTAQSGFNEGVKGDEIPDVPATQPTEPPDASAAVSELPTEPTQLTTDVPSTEPTEPSTEPPATVTEPSTEEPSVADDKNIQKLSGILIYGNAGFEYYNFVQSASEQYAAAVNRAAELFQGKATVYDMIIPTSIDIQLPESVRAQVSVSDQKRAIAYMEALLSPSVKKVSIFDEMLAHKNEYIYFRTDHHWTGLGAYYAYLKFCEVKGVEPVRLEDCELRSFSPFLGSFYSDSGKDPALGDTPDTVDTYMPKVNADIYLIDESGREIKGNVIYNAETNSPYYKYSAFIWGDNPYSVITNYDKTEGESCLLIKESFGNALAPLLTYNYKYVYILDYRYGYTTAAALVEKYGITDVFFCNNISMTRAASQVSNLYSSVG